jgi:DMSO/TMAO reductase YedYZ molybdopterin-dependent catalytic subunit
VTAGGLTLAGFHDLRLPAFCDDGKGTLPKDGFVGRVEFIGEGHIPMQTLLDEGLDGRLYTDLSSISSENLIIPTQKFYVRTRASKFLSNQQSWLVKARGLLRKPGEISMADFRRLATPLGPHLMECSGNVRLGHFGMLSVADWAGVPVSDLLDSWAIDRAASHVLISGFDRYPMPSAESVPGASWVFPIDDLISAKAFLATEMNAAPLPRDHGSPLRLVVPGWYGCACIKWVDEIAVLGEGGETTSQMREFAQKTMQNGVPQFVKDYRPALIEQAAMPVHIEKWLVAGKIEYRITGIAWGGSHSIKKMGIRFSSEFYSGDDFVPLDHFEQTANDPWTVWTHLWKPAKPGLYFIQLKVLEQRVPARRLDSGYYVRSVEIDEV